MIPHRSPEIPLRLYYLLLVREDPPVGEFVCVGPPGPVVSPGEEEPVSGLGSDPLKVLGGDVKGMTLRE